MIRLCAPHFTAGLILNNGRVVATAPILAFMFGWHADRVYKFARTHKWAIAWI